MREIAASRYACFLMACSIRECTKLTEMFIGSIIGYWTFRISKMILGLLGRKVWHVGFKIILPKHSYSRIQTVGSRFH